MARVGRAPAPAWVPRRRHATRQASFITGVLVTGVAGYIGGHILLALLDAGEDVTVIENLSTGFESTVPGRAKLLAGDVGDAGLREQVPTHHKIDAIIHFAGSIVVPESVREPLRYYENNTCCSRTFLECAVNAGVKQFIFSSTAAVYGIPKENPVFEDAQLVFVSPYGSSKMMTEIMLRDAVDAHDLRYVALRYFNVADADPQLRNGQATAQATHLGTCIRDYVRVTDLARAHLSALAHMRRGGGAEVLNCGYGRGFSVLEAIGSVKRVSGVDFPVRKGPRRPGDPAILIAGSERIKTVLGWRADLDDLDTIAKFARIFSALAVTAGF